MDFWKFFNDKSTVLQEMFGLSLSRLSFLFAVFFIPASFLAAIRHSEQGEHLETIVALFLCVLSAFYIIGDFQNCNSMDIHSHRDFKHPDSPYNDGDDTTDTTDEE